MAIALIFALVATVAASGDSITLHGTSIAMPNCTIRQIEAGQIVYLDARGGRRQLPIEDVQCISFDGLPKLDEAEEMAARSEYARAIKPFLHALLDAENDMQRLWIRSRLALMHDLMDQRVQAAGHFAALLMLEEHVSWLRLEPAGELDRPSYAAAREAMEMLEQARRRVRQPQLAAAVNRLHGAARPVYEALAEAYDGPAVVSGSTLSGFTIEEIRAAGREDDDAGAPGPPRRSAEEPQAPARAPQQPAAAPDAVEALLSAGRHAEALAACEEIMRRPGRRDLGQVFNQCGRALLGLGRPEDAAVMFARGAILHRDSPFTPLSLIELATIYRDAYGRLEVAARLLDRAAAEESQRDRPEVFARIEWVRGSMADRRE